MCPRSDPGTESPPHMRGKAAPSRPVRQSSRITPAYAGKRGCRTLEWPDCRDHPRVCGEKRMPPRIGFWLRGSPPRMRGKGILLRKTMRSNRITPAYAGKSWAAHEKDDVTLDHPRVCGEKICGIWLKCRSLGSPPRMRGKGAASFPIDIGPRITPAYAGKRLKRSRSTVPPVAIVPLFPSVCNKTVVSDGSPAGRDAPLFLPAENAVPASPAYNLRFL